MSSKIPDKDWRATYRAFMTACAGSPEVLARWGAEFTGPELAFVSAHLAPGPVLVAGCGHGRGIAWLTGQGRSVEAVDSDGDMCALTRRSHDRAGVRVHQAELELLGAVFSGRTFGTILALGLVSGGLFLPGQDSRAALAGLAAVLSPGGALLMDFLDAGPGPRGRVQRFDYPLGDDRSAKGCCYWPTRAEVKAALWEVGLRCTLIDLDDDPEAPLVGVAARCRGDNSVMDQ